ncbi:PREDICTED: uncharacterized protein LOC109344723 [Lupinus angustifolius]|uniref:uncharacterized protein LOC109344723 n=1 Tax=Lupinus angustifolius TaxID=3871 RepID=UPI00092E5061|nr:PREDICTED: uncharacterized protein LOC109344723 [Lupinus angustifolius]
MDVNERVAQFFNRIMSHKNHMKACGEVINDQTIIEKILRTITPKFDHIVVAIEESKRLEELKLEEVQGSLEAHEQRLIERSSDKTIKQALQAQMSKKGGYYSRGGSRSRGRGKEFKGKNTSFQFQDQERHDYDHPSSTTTRRGGFNNWKGGKKRIDKKKIKCFNCNKVGHFSNECQAPPSQIDPNSRNHDEAHVAKKESVDKDDESSVLLMMTTN